MRIIICLSVLFISLLANSQSILPAAKSFKPSGKRQTTTPISQEERLENFRNFYSDTATSLFIRQEGNKDRKTFTELLDSLAGEPVEDDEKIELENRIIELNKSNAVRPLATGGISNLENSSQSYGSLSVGLQFRLTKYKLIGKKNWIDPQFITVLYSEKTATSPDS